MDSLNSLPVRLTAESKITIWLLNYAYVNGCSKYVQCLLSEVLGGIAHLAPIIIIMVISPIKIVCLFVKFIGISNCNHRVSKLFGVSGWEGVGGGGGTSWNIT